MLTSNNQVHAENSEWPHVLDTFPGVKTQNSGQSNVENVELPRVLDTFPGVKAQMSQQMNQQGQVYDGLVSNNV